MKLAVVLGLACFLLPGIFMIGAGSRNVWRGVASSDWPEAPGVVASSSRASGVVFNYTKDGRDYSTELIRFGQTQGASDSSEAQLQRLRYPTGLAVAVRVHPDDPSIAVVEPGFHSDSLWLPGAGLAFAMSAILFGVLALGPEANFAASGLGLFAAIFVLIGVPMLTAGALNLWRAYESRGWPVVPGLILSGSGQLDKVEAVPGEEETTRGRGLIYRYEVAGRKRYSDVMAFGQTPDSAGGGGLFPYGATVKVAYDPRDPALAVLEPGITKDAYFLPGAGAAFLLFGLAAFFFGIPALRE